MLDAVLAAAADLDVTVAYCNQPRPWDAVGLRALARERWSSWSPTWPARQPTSWPQPCTTFHIGC
jgi:hypothetical protein